MSVNGPRGKTTPTFPTFSWQHHGPKELVLSLCASSSFISVQVGHHLRKKKPIKVGGNFWAGFSQRRKLEAWKLAKWGLMTLSQSYRHSQSARIHSSSSSLWFHAGCFTQIFFLFFFFAKVVMKSNVLSFGRCRTCLTWGERERNEKHEIDGR